MAWYAGSAIVFWTICLGLSVASRKRHPFVDRPAFVVVGMISVFLGVSVLVGGCKVASQSEPAYGVIFFMLGFIPGLTLLIPWVLRAVAILVDEGARAVTGVDSMKVKRTYDAAERLMFDRKFDEAEREFLAGAAAEADDPNPLRRAGEAALAAGRIADAVRHFRSALARISSDEDRASLGIRIAEIEERKLGDPAGARKTLEGLLPELSAGKWGSYVRERLERLRT